MTSLTVADPESPQHDTRWLDAKFRSPVRRKLLRWFDQNARTLPWRSDPTPYRVWISEIMLQQTQVATVLPYYQRFMETFPDVDALAAADESELMRHWEGLGYYRRARSMHAAAKQIVQEHDGAFPVDFDQVLALPGIGRYTAGAILSISGDARYPILEGNTQRVFSRWVALRSPPVEKAATKLLWQIAEAMLPPKKGSNQFNQAAMELGALVCTPRSPGCDVCPIEKHCAAKELGLEEEIPGKKPKIHYESRREYAFVIRQPETPNQKRTEQEPRYLMRALPDGVRWSGLWDFPRTIERSLDSVDLASQEVAKTIGADLLVGDKLTRIKHAVTKYRIELSVHYAQFDPELTLQETKALVADSSPWVFVSGAEMAKLPLSMTGRKIAKLLDGGDNRRS